MEGIHSCGKSGPLVTCVTLCSLTKWKTKRKTYTQLTMLGRAFGDDGTSNIIVKTLKKSKANKILMMHAM